MPLPGMIVYATPSSPSQPSEKEANSGAAEGAAPIGDFAQLLFMILAPQSAVINQSPASSEGEIAEGLSATVQTALTASPETIPSSEVDPLQMEPVAGAANFEIAPEELAATTSNVDSVSLDNISSSNETVAPIQSAHGGSVPVMTEQVATAKIPADAETVLGQSAGEQKQQVLGTTGSPDGQVHGTTAAHTREVASASAARQPVPSLPDAATNAVSADEPATLINLSASSEDQHPKNDLLGGENRSKWPDMADRDLPMSDRPVQAGNAFNTFIARREHDPGVAEAPPNWRPLVDRLAGDISSHLRMGKSEAVLQLEPPELGKIKIDLSMEDGRLHARIVAEGHDSKALIEAHLPELRQALLAGKIEVAEVRISQGSWSGAGDLGQGLQEQQRGRQEAGSRFDAPATRSEDGAERRPQTLPRESGRVSMWA
jgi:flagellar hook-length control protein FliK